MVHQPQIIIIGAGVVGLSTAYALLSTGMRNVRVLEQAVVNHTRAASASLSRLLRFEYGADPFYPRMVKLSLELWRALERHTQMRLYTPTGVLSLGREGDDTERARKIACDLGLASERLSAFACRQRFPQFEIGGYDTLTYNTEGGILHASLCLQALKHAILDLGGQISETSRVTQVVPEGADKPIHLGLSSGETLTAERVVIAIGPWVHRLLGGLRMPIELTRQYLLYFAGLAPSSFGVGVFPAFMECHLYGFPIYRGSHFWLKAASHEFGRPVDPDAASHLEEGVIVRTQRELQELVPALRRAELVHVETCVYDISPDEDFILDSLPGEPRVVFATGLSGHGFKFGPLLGRLLGSLVCGTQPEVPLARFRLARFSRYHTRQPASVA
jgi:monomeric sarcosine oxidase